MEGMEAEKQEEARRKKEIPSPYDRINIYHPKKPYLISPFSFCEMTRNPEKKGEKKKKRGAQPLPTYT